MDKYTHPKSILTHCRETVNFILDHPKDKLVCQIDSSDQKA